ncbi:pilus (MSHA type) biogenesis protein MshL [Campylobacter ureolyticus]|uniref:MSHA biogenesis protein MshL n=1 Tax=Campylobacter ureolyticus TaxID=827 RepID=S5U2D5_9BACT|nr:pilus (MSHA type) biogenesis protein MshL [Campylobacter ureolyticus]AGS56944.1 MSHA biogenesis protein MshL [Campylobacter ureolyticus DSM 20703]MCR8684304.1 pilus (MSHA type) biogenesis protein MshL [Campylobacter ureolyticus]QKF84337.1 transformation system protein CtsD [Campylobacter ureolyticus]QQY35506.1 pilus (MSHA type) biogenesis protein MshL [Campylobacter ureolyticus]SUX23193.1 type II and III secretion system protein [Campylobacter ureolyticus]
MSKLTKKLALSLILALGLSTGLNASTCDKRAFNISITDTVTLNDILTQLSDTCNFSIVAKDAIAAEALKKELAGVSIKNLSLREVFNILINENNLGYEFNNQALMVSALQTKTFKIDYITSIREGSAIVRASTDSSPKEFDAERNAEIIDDNVIRATEKFDFWANVSDEITYILNNGTEKYEAIPPIINQNAGLVTVTATKAQLKRVDEYIKELQRRLKRQVMLDVTIIEVQLNNSYTKGIDWSKFELGFNTYVDNKKTPSVFNFGNPANGQRTLNIIPDGDANSKYGTLTSQGWSGKASTSNGVWAIGANLNFNINGAINFLETKGKTKVISNPKVMTLNNQQAIITVGDIFNYILIESKNSSDSSTTVSENRKMYSTFIGILLNITPEISDQNKIMLRINPSLSELKYKEDDKKQDTPRSIAPDTREKKVSTVITVNDGDTVILGGMIAQSKDKKNTNVPVLSEIPLLGNLFKSTGDILSTTELVFIITPRLMDNAGKNIADSLKDLGYSKSLYTYE